MSGLAPPQDTVRVRLARGRPPTIAAEERQERLTSCRAGPPVDRHRSTAHPAATRGVPGSSRPRPPRSLSRRPRPRRCRRAAAPRPATTRLRGVRPREASRTSARRSGPSCGLPRGRDPSAGTRTDGQPPGAEAAAGELRERATRDRRDERGRDERDRDERGWDERDRRAAPHRAGQRGAGHPSPAARAWALPVAAGYRLTARFGECSGLWSRCHTGLDFAAPSGTPVRAVAAGTVTEVGWAGAYGNRAVITLGGRHGDLVRPSGRGRCRARDGGGGRGRRRHGGDDRQHHRAAPAPGGPSGRCGPGRPCRGARCPRPDALTRPRPGLRLRRPGLRAVVVWRSASSGAEPVDRSRALPRTASQRDADTRPEHEVAWVRASRRGRSATAAA